MHFEEISNLQFGKERHTLLCILKLFTNIICELSRENAWLPPIFFLDFNETCQDLHPFIIINRGKNTFELVGTVLKSQYGFLFPSSLVY